MTACLTRVCSPALFPALQEVEEDENEEEAEDDVQEDALAQGAAKGGKKGAAAKGGKKKAAPKGAWVGAVAKTLDGDKFYSKAKVGWAGWQAGSTAGELQYRLVASAGCI